MQVPTSTLAQSAVTPDKRSGGFYADVIDIGDGSSGTGSHAFTGFGFQPKAILVIGARPSTGNASIFYSGYAYDTGSGVTQGATSAVYSSSGPAGSAKVSTTAAFYAIGSSGATDFAASVTSFDPDGFTANVTTGIGTLDIRTFHVIAFG